MIRVPHYVASIQPYVPGKPVEELERELGIKDSVKLASNENPLGPSPKAVAALSGNTLGTLNRYPDGGNYYLRQALAKKLDVSEDSLIFGNGSNELLDIAVRTFMEPGEDAVMAWPSFVVYPMAVQAVGCNGIKVPLTEDFRHDLGAMADAITDKTRMVFIANPNNPTGTINTKAEFDSFMSRVPKDIIVVVDEAYFEYATDESYADSMGHLRQGRNLLILRTFSKAYGLAGLRIGYGITLTSIASEMNKIREPFNTSSPAQVAALAALEDDEHIENSVRVNAAGKEYLYAELAKLEGMGIKYVPTHANFIFMLPGVDAGALNGALLKRGVIIRPMGEKAVRVTIGLEQENKAFIKALKEAMDEVR
ncbi:MAG: histidinol-phosphate transaminase [Thermodesulfovibrionales bacterium]|nr:histidinol-phosphate transaminase [Thermodesulfovibrionales bacterium]